MTCRRPGISRLTIEGHRTLSDEDKEALEEWLDRHDMSTDDSGITEIWVLGVKTIIYYLKRDENGQHYQEGGDIAKSFRIVDTRGWPL